MKIKQHQHNPDSPVGTRKLKARGTRCKLSSWLMPNTIHIQVHAVLSHLLKKKQYAHKFNAVKN